MEKADQLVHFPGIGKKVSNFLIVHLEMAITSDSQKCSKNSSKSSQMPFIQILQKVKVAFIYFGHLSSAICLCILSPLYSADIDFLCVL
jgi:Holliday junction resolvasome RuvABC DNA-binding subunit